MRGRLKREYLHKIHYTRIMLHCRQYFDTISEEINDVLQEQGQVSFAELTKQYDLPGDFLSAGVRERLGKFIHGRIDDFNPDTIFTQAFVDKFKARIRGTFSAVTRYVKE
jgi:hypothetical protein